MTPQFSLPIVADGAARWHSATRQAIREEVVAKYSERLYSTGVLFRWRVHLQIKREIEMRVRAIAPSAESLY